MNARRRNGLLALNAFLLALLALVTFAPGAGAQPRMQRPQGQYSLVDGKFQGAQEAALYVFDSANEELIALRWDRSRKSLSTIGYRDIHADLEQAKKGTR